MFVYAGALDLSRAKSESPGALFAHSLSKQTRKYIAAVMQTELSSMWRHLQDESRGVSLSGGRRVHDVILTWVYENDYMCGLEL